MTAIFLIYGSWFAGFLILLLLSWLIFDKRYKKREDDAASMGKPPNGYLRTSEAFIDPKDGLKYRVYYNPRTGEREYIREE
jgi:hypothetical protein